MDFIKILKLIADEKVPSRVWKGSREIEILIAIIAVIKVADAGADP